jgi:hypothetical protein
LVEKVPKSAKIDVPSSGKRQVRIQVVPLEDFAGVMQGVQNGAFAGTVRPEE